MNPNQTVVSILNQACTLYQDKVAFTCLGQTLSFADLDRLGNAFAAFLQNCTALQPGDRIAIQLPNLLQYPVVVLGALRAGLTIVNTNPLYTTHEMIHQLNDSGAAALVVISVMESKALEAAEKSHVNTIIFTDALDLHKPIHPSAADSSDHGIKDLTTDDAVLNRYFLRVALELGLSLQYNHVAISPDQLAAIQYTGGTTGAAKGAMLSHKNLVANAQQFTNHSKEYFQEGKAIYVAPLPLYHIYAFTVNLLGITSTGGNSVLIPNPRDIPSLVSAIKPLKFTGFIGINTLFKGLCNDQDFRQLDFRQLKSTVSGGMALDPEVAREWERITGVTVSEGYGMTEASPVISSNPPGRNILGTVGSPVPKTEIKVVDQSGNILAAGEAGELYVKGPQIMQGYWQHPEATAEVMTADGWLKTGDVAIIRDNGYITIVDRIKDIIMVSGFNVYPNEVEGVAIQHPSVRECAAISVPDQRTGEAIKLFVVPSGDDFDADILRNFMREQLTGYKIPARIEIIAELPKSNVGKILRRELR